MPTKPRSRPLAKFAAHAVERAVATVRGDTDTPDAQQYDTSPDVNVVPPRVIRRRNRPARIPCDICRRPEHPNTFRVITDLTTKRQYNVCRICTDSILQSALTSRKA